MKRVKHTTNLDAGLLRMAKERSKQTRARTPSLRKNKEFVTELTVTIAKNHCY